MKEFESMYREYFPRIYNFLYRLCADTSVCEEMTQETFYQAFLSIHRYNGSCELFTWLAAIAKNTYFHYLRKNKIQFVNLELLILTDDENQPETVVEKRFEAVKVRQAVEKLPKKYRDVVVLHIYAGLPYAEVGKLLGISEGTAKVTFHRAKKILKEALMNENQL